MWHEGEGLIGGKNLRSEKEPFGKRITEENELDELLSAMGPARDDETKKKTCVPGVG